MDNNTFLVLDEGQITLQDHFQNQGYKVVQLGKVWHGANRALRLDEPKPDLANEKPRRPGWNQEWFTPIERIQQQEIEPDYWDRVHSPYRNLKPHDPSVYAWAINLAPFPLILIMRSEDPREHLKMSSGIILIFMHRGLSAPMKHVKSFAHIMPV